MRWQRDRIVGSRSSALDDDEHDDRARRRLLERLQQRVGGDGRRHAQLLRLEQQQHLALTLDRAAMGLGDHLLADVVDLVRRAAGLELDDVGMHAARREALGARRRRRRRVAPRSGGRRLRPRSLAARRAGTRATGVRPRVRARRALAPARSRRWSWRADYVPSERRARRLPRPVPRPRRGCRARRPAASPVPPPARGTPRAPRRGTRPRPVPSGPASAATRPFATSSGRSSTTTRSGSRSPAANALKPLDGVDAERAADALVGERRRRVAVADDHRPGGERGADHLGDVLRPVREHQQQLGPRVDLPVRVQQQEPDLLTDARVARARA